MQNVGIINKYISNTYALSGPLARSCGLHQDVRFNTPYETFQYKPIPVVCGYLGDNLTRFFIRLEELFISIQYIEFLMVQLA